MAGKALSKVERLKLFGPDVPIDLMAAMREAGTPVAWILGLPLNLDECTSYQAYQAGIETPKDGEILRAWQVKMALVHGSWIMERFDFRHP